MKIPRSKLKPVRKPQVDPRRATGRTTRMMQGVVEAAIDARRIIVICHDYNFIYYLRGILDKLTKVARYNDAMRTATLENGTTVAFCVWTPELEDQLRGYPVHTPRFVDHFVYTRSR